MPESEGTLRLYQPGTRRLVRTESTPVPTVANDEGIFDPAGNRVFSIANRTVRTPYRLYAENMYHDRVPAASTELAAYYYGADDRLRVVDRRGCLTFESRMGRQACDQQYEPTFEQKSAFEEYRYDALGRRVLVRTRPASTPRAAWSTCTAPSWTRRWPCSARSTATASAAASTSRWKHLACRAPAT